jgi:acetoacetyl-[acyl-carrier protein] synthase
LSHLPLIVGFGGISPAGRSSFHHGYRRLILDHLSHQDRQQTLLSLATLMGLVQYQDGNYLNAHGESHPLDDLLSSILDQILDHTLIRRIEPECFDVDHVMFNKQASLQLEQPIQFTLKKRQMPTVVPENWQVESVNAHIVQVTVKETLEAILPDTKTAQVQSAGQLPSGFKPDDLYQSRNHPRNIQMTVYAASDAVSSTGIDFTEIMSKVAPDQVAVYASNSIGQLDDLGFGGLTKYPALGKRTTSKQMPLGYAQMPADFVNAYLLGNVGSTGGSLGACATFLYNLRSAVDDIRTGRRKVVLVGGSDAPVIPEVIEGFRAMGALAEDKDLLALNNVDALTKEHYQSACRPFGDNCGFTIAEASQFVMLMSDDLALELGAEVYGAVPDVFVNADGHKKSISAPGVGNYITMAKSASLIRAMMGEESLKKRSYVQAHGTSTPQNRVTESHVINETAKAFGIQDWTVSAIKCFIGHSQGTAAGDQLAFSLGTWAHGIIPGIRMTPNIADDVYTSNLNLAIQDTDVGIEGMDSVILNSKGFGGNNASAPVIAPHIVEAWLAHKHGASAVSGWKAKREHTREKAAAYDQQATLGLARPTYLYDHQVLEGYDLTITDKAIHFPGYAHKVDIDVENPFSDFTHKPNA